MQGNFCEMMQGLTEGADYFFRSVDMHVVKPHAVHGKEVQGYASPRKFRTMVRFCVCSDFSLKYFQKLPFLYKN